MTPKAPEAPAAPALTFAEVDVPEVTRTVPPNPFTEAVAKLAASMPAEGKDRRSARALSVTLPKAADAKAHKVSRNRLARQLSDAGKAANVSVRKIVAEQKDGTAQVTFWTAPRITRKRKATETQESAAPAEAK